jgi:hypothetical protein
MLSAAGIHDDLGPFQGDKAADVLETSFRPVYKEIHTRQSDTR